ncbi:MAG: glycosyltransferase [Bacteroidota bacterium]
MTNNKYDLAVVYRIYPKVSKVPPIFSDDKFKLSELCLKSFRQSLGDLKIKLWVLLDNCPEEYTTLFKKYFAEDEIELIILPGIGNGATFGKQMDILLAQCDSDYVYFAEDDYFYLEGTFSEMLEFIKENSDVHFVTPFDHLDYYKSYLHKYPVRTKETLNRKWKTAGSTCMTFLTRKEILEKTKSVFYTYTKNNWDASLWFSLTNHKVIKLSFILSLFNFKMEAIKIFLKAWIHSPRQILFGKKWNLWVPIPSLSTHMDEVSLAPEINWQEKFQEMIVE